jgi:hypothetical protein
MRQQIAGCVAQPVPEELATIREKRLRRYTVTNMSIWKIALYCSFAAMASIVLLRVGGGILGRIIGGPRTPLFILGETGIFLLGGVMLTCFYRWSIGVVLVSWIDAVLILGRIFPWAENGLAGFFSQFTTDLIFFAAAHLALISAHMMRRLHEPHVV